MFDDLSQYHFHGAHTSSYPYNSVIYTSRFLYFAGRIRLTTNELIISSTISSDAGIYQCMANNAHGFASAAGQLFVNDTLRPPAPIDVRCRALNSSTIHVAWNISDEKGQNGQPPIIIQENNNRDRDMLSNDNIPVEGSPSTAYVIAYFPSGMYSLFWNRINLKRIVYCIPRYSRKRCLWKFLVFTDHVGRESMFPTTSKMMDITNLNASENYTFYVKAFNGASGSEPSESVSCTTHDKGEWKF